MGKKLGCLFIAAAIITVSLAGCWDKVEIDQRALVGIVMVDMAPPGYEEKVAESVKGIPGVEKQGGKMIKVAYTFPIAAALAGEGGGGGGKEPGYSVYSSVATDIDKCNRYVDSRLSRRLFFGFTQVAVLSEDLFKNPDKAKEVLDYFRRNPGFNRSMRILVAEGEASKLAEIVPKGEKLLFRYLKGILENNTSNPRISDISFNEFIVQQQDTGTGVIPKIDIEKEEVKIAGLGLIKDFKIIGYLSEYDTFYYNALMGKRKSGAITINVGDLSLDYVVRSASRTVKLINSDPKSIEIGIRVSSEGSILGSEADKEIYDTETISKIEKELDTMDMENAKFIISKLQGEFKVDALGMGEYIRKFHPSLWEKVGTRWSDVYPTIKITPVMDNKIRRIGTVK